MDSAKCTQTYLWELDEDFRTTGDASADNDLKRNILASLRIPKNRENETLANKSEEDSSGSDEEDFNDIKLNVLLEPDCGYPCEKDLGWFEMAQSSAPWDEARRPYNQILQFDDLELTDKEKDGQLSGMMISTGINLFDRVPLTDGFALTKLQLPNRGLIDIQLLDAYKNLQYIDISHNSIVDISPLAASAYLVVLDASHNEIRQFTPNPTPWFITYLNLSYNRFQSVPDVSSMWSLKHLNLSNNFITGITGLKNLGYLEYLNLSHNQIEVINNIADVPLKTLDLSWNHITHCEEGGMNRVSTLRRVDLSHNNLKTMSSLEGVEASNIRHLNIAFNKFDCVNSFDGLARFEALRYLRMEGNELIHQLPEIAHSILHMLPQLDYVNGNKLTVKERLTAFSMWTSDEIVSEMKNYCVNLLYGNVEPPDTGIEAPAHINHSVPVVLLVGPAGTRKHQLARAVENKYPDYVRVPALHTTMFATTNHLQKCEELNAMKVRHVNDVEFLKAWNDGKFLFVYKDFGDLFGLSRDELALDDWLYLIPVKIGPALSLTWLGLNTTLILIQTKDDTEYSDLLQRYVVTLFNIHAERNTLNELKSAEDLVQKVESSGVTDLANHKSAASGRSIEPNWENSIHVASESEGEDHHLIRNSIEGVPPPVLRTSVTDSKSGEVDGSLSGLSREHPWWCDEESEEEVSLGTPLPADSVPFIGTLKASQLEKEDMWKLYVTSYDEKLAYQETVGMPYFAHAVTTGDVGRAMKKLVPLLADKYNEWKRGPELVVEAKDDPLYEVLVEPRLKELMSLLTEGGGLVGLRDPEEHDPSGWDIDSSEPSKDSLSAPFFSPATSSLAESRSTSLTDYGSEERQLEEPEHFWAPEPLPPTPPSPSSSYLETLGKQSLRSEGFRIFNSERNIKYSNTQP